MCRCYHDIYVKYFFLKIFPGAKKQDSLGKPAPLLVWNKYVGLVKHHAIVLSVRKHNIEKQLKGIKE